MARRVDREKGSERRRRLAEVNLLSEPRTKSAGTRRGCALLPIIGLGATLLGIGAALVSGHL
jgi:hypothetical protein